MNWMNKYLLLNAYNVNIVKKVKSLTIWIILDI